MKVPPHPKIGGRYSTGVCPSTPASAVFRQLLEGEAGPAEVGESCWLSLHSTWHWPGRQTLRPQGPECHAGTRKGSITEQLPTRSMGCRLTAVMVLFSARTLLKNLFSGKYSFVLLSESIKAQVHRKRNCNNINNYKEEKKKSPKYPC